MTTQTIRDIEARIMRKVIEDALAAGYALGVHDGESKTVANSRDPEAIFAALRTTDEDFLMFTLGDKPVGWVFFVYGNDGHDVINDYTTSLEPVMVEAERLADELEEAA
jgi:hypothetical protein